MHLEYPLIVPLLRVGAALLPLMMMMTGDLLAVVPLDVAVD